MKIRVFPLLLMCAVFALALWLLSDSPASAQTPGVALYPAPASTPAPLAAPAAADGLCANGGCWRYDGAGLSSCAADYTKGTLNLRAVFPRFTWLMNDPGRAVIWWRHWIWTPETGWVTTPVNDGWSNPHQQVVFTTYGGYNNWVFIEDNVYLIENAWNDPKKYYLTLPVNQFSGPVWVAVEWYISLSGRSNEAFPQVNYRDWFRFNTPSNIYCGYGTTRSNSESLAAPQAPPGLPEDDSLPALAVAPEDAPPPLPPAGQHRTYLPLLVSSNAPGVPVATPTPVPSQPTRLPPTPSGPATSGDMLNADFEAGRNVGWIETSSRNYAVVGAGPKGYPARSGDSLAWLGGVENEVSSISQTLTVPATHPYLSLYIMAYSNEADCFYDRATISVDEFWVGTIRLCKQYNAHSWTRGQLNLRAFAGQRVKLMIKAENDASLISHIFVDDISFESGVVLATPAPTRTPAPNNGSVRNPGFELGDNGDWSSWTKSGARNIFLNDGSHSGKWLAWLGGAHSEDGYIEQTLYVPNDKPYLTYWGWISSSESACSGDNASFWAGNTQLFSYSLCSQYNNTRWGQGWLNFKAYSGTTQKIRIRVQTNGSQLSSLYLDDFAWAASPPSAGVTAWGEATGAAPTGVDGQPDSMLELAPFIETETKFPTR